MNLRRLRVFAVALVLSVTLARVLSAHASLVWGNYDGGVPMSDAAAAYAACPNDGYPHEGDDLTPCQVDWYNGAL
jgi:hypothetical protein